MPLHTHKTVKKCKKCGKYTTKFEHLGKTVHKHCPNCDGQKPKFMCIVCHKKTNMIIEYAACSWTCYDKAQIGKRYNRDKTIQIDKKKVEIIRQHSPKFAELITKLM